MKACEIARILENLSPKKFACDWDNVGMHVGRKDNEIKKILVSLDIDDRTVEKAVAIHADMIVSHHPLIFKGIKQINDDDIVGRRILTMAENHINGYCMHTNFDSVGGMAQEAAEIIGLKDSLVLEEILEGEGIGRVGNLDESITVRELCEEIKQRFSLKNVILYGNAEDKVSRVAIVPGSGKDDIELAIRNGATVMITGDMTYHYGIDSVSKGINIIDAGHYGLEHIFIGKIGAYLEEMIPDIEVVRMPVCNPQQFI